MKTTLANQPLAELLDQHSRIAAPSFRGAEGDRIRCLACGHRCLIGEGQRGICKVRFKEAGSSRSRLATLPAYNAILSRRSRFSMSILEATRSRSG